MQYTPFEAFLLPNKQYIQTFPKEMFLLSTWLTKAFWETNKGLLLPKCRNLPFGERATRGSQVRLPREEGARSRHQRLFEENVGKTETCGLQNLSVKGSGVVFTHGEGISTPRVRHKGRQPLIKCARHDFKIMYFSFFMFFIFWAFLYFYLFVGLFVFFIFLWSTRVFPSLLRILNCDEEIRPT